MKHKLASVICCAALGGAIFGTAATAAAKKKTTASKSRSKSRKAVRRKAAGPSYQLHPAPERYKEIQQALADKGYFKGAVNGEWGSDSVDALKRFQTDNKLPDEGKITSASLIQLGLGPKHEGNGVNPSAPVSSPAEIPPAPKEEAATQP